MSKLDIQTPLRWALVGGGHRSNESPAFIAHAHNRAIHTSGTRRIVCGALHEDAEAARFSADNWPYRIFGYDSFEEMVRHQAVLDFDNPQRIHAATVATPNHCHFAQAMALVNAGIPVVCEKPMTITAAEAMELATLVHGKGLPFMVFHTYWGHAMTQFARLVVTSGLIGRVIRARAFYDQDWLRQFIENSVRQAWRGKKKKAGISCCGADIGIHAQKQLEFITGHKVVKILFSRLLTLVAGRELDDDFTVRAVLDNGAEVDISASQIKAGHRNRLWLEVNGTEATLIQDCENPEELQILRPNKPVLVYRRGQISPHDGFIGDLPAWVASLNFWPAGHPEGLTDAGQRLYDYFEVDLRRYYNQGCVAGDEKFYATVDDGVGHMKFIEAAVECHNTGRPVDIV